MKKKFEKTGKPLSRADQKNVAGGKKWECAPIGYQTWPYDPTAIQGLFCCSGCFDGNGVCITCGGGGGIGHPCPPPLEHLMCFD